MKYRPRSCVWVIFALLFFAPCAAADKPTWTKRDVNFLADCYSGEHKRCPDLRIFSPDRLNYVNVTYHRLNIDNGDYVWFARGELVRHNGKRSDIELPGLTEHEIEWSLDSRAFLVNGSDAGMGPVYVVVYLLADDDLHPHHVNEEAQRDLVRSIPPCRAMYLSKSDCEAITSDPEENTNIFGVAFTRGSSAVVVLASYVCSSSMGGIMCQSIGYEVDIQTGKILKRMEPKEFKRLWQHSLAWKYDIESPEYKDDTPSKTLGAPH